METFLLLTKIFGISFTSGVNLYATVGLVGMAIRFNLIQNLPEQLNVLANEYVIGVALTMYICEFIADKIPAFDSVWDGFHTFIRPLAAAALALMAVGDSPLYIKIIAVLLAGSVAFTSHTAKAGTRLLVNTSPEPFSNSIISIAEDIGVVALVVLILTHPLIAAVVVAVLLALIIWQGPKLVSLIVFMVKAIYYKFVSLRPYEKFVNIELLPEKFNIYLNNLLTESEKIYITLSTTFKGYKRASGFVVVSTERLIILYKKWFGMKHFEIPLSDIKRMTFKSGVLTDKISFYHEKKQINMIFFKSNNRNLRDIINIFKSLEVDISDGQPLNKLPEAETV